MTVFAALQTFPAVDLVLSFCFRYQMMRDCWQTHPGDRPSFTELRQRLEAMIEDASPADYLRLCPDTNTYCYHSTTTSSSASDMVEVEDAVFAIRAPKMSFAESLRRDSGVGERSSTATSASQLTLPSINPPDDRRQLHRWLEAEIGDGSRRTATVGRPSAGVFGSSSGGSVYVPSSGSVVRSQAEVGPEGSHLSRAPDGYRAPTSGSSISPTGRVDSGFSYHFPSC